MSAEAERSYPGSIVDVCVPSSIDPIPPPSPPPIQLVPASKLASKDEEYYLDTVTFWVEGTLFKVPRVRFANESEVFRDMFSLPQAATEGAEGTTDISPIELAGVKTADFRALLKVMYPLKSAPKLVLSKEQWASALKLANMWLFRDIRKLAMEQLSTLGLTSREKILFGREFKVKHWLLQGYVERVAAAETISINEATEIGFDTAVRLLQHRERKSGSHSYSINTSIANDFVAELGDIQREELALGEYQIVESVGKPPTKESDRETPPPIAESVPTPTLRKGRPMW